MQKLWHFLVYQVEEVVLLALDGVLYVSDRLFTSTEAVLGLARMMLTAVLIGAAIYFL